LSKFVEADVVTSLTFTIVDDPAATAGIELPDTGRLRARTRVVTTKDLGMIGGEGDGWFRQQVAKLLFARYVSTEFYMVLDSKNIVVNPVTADDLVRDGRAAWVLEPISPRKSSWWRGSAWALEHRAFERKSGAPGVSSATPFLFHTGTVVTMVDWLERRRRQRLQQLLADRKRFRGRFFSPTEFTLYYVFLDREQIAHRYHFASDRLHDTASQIWFRTSPEERSVRIRRIVTSQAAGLFTGIQRSAWNELPDRERCALADWAKSPRIAA
jgi:hypothetical protein